MNIYRLAIVLAATLVFAVPAIGAGKDDAPGTLNLDLAIPYQKFTLSNGLRVVVHEDRKAPIVAVHVWYHVGSKDEPEGRTGFAHLFEHLMYGGSENYDGEFSAPFAAVGATNMNGTTWFDRTAYFEDVPTPALEMALWMESDRMGHLLGVVTQEKLDKQVGVVKNEKREGDNAPYGLVEYRQLEGLFPPGHPYRHSTIGSMEDLDAASLEDVKSWFNQYYGAANTVVVLSGDIDAATARPLMEKYFGHIPAGPPLRRHTAWVPSRTNNTVEEMVDASAPQTRLYRVWAVAPRTHDDAVMLDLASEALGGGKNSRLYQALVYQNPLATSVEVNMQPFELASTFKIEISLRPGADEARVERLLDEVVKRYLAEGPTPEELARGKAYLLSTQMRRMEQVGGAGKAAMLAQGEVYAGDPGFHIKSLNRLNTADAEAVKAASNEWLGEGHYQLTVRPAPEHTTSPPAIDRTAGLPAVGALPDVAFPEVEEATLENGVKVVLARRSGVPVVNVGVQFDAGYAADAGARLGTAKFALDMMDEGTESRSALEISDEIERLGGEITTKSNLDASALVLAALKPNLDRSLMIFADVVRHAEFAQEEIERLRRQQLARIDREKADPELLALRNLPELLYGDGHPYSVPFTGSGTEDSITGLTRDDLLRFQRDWLRPDKATIFVVGDVTMAEALPALERAFGDWRAPSTPGPAKDIAQASLPSKSRVVIIDMPGLTQSVVLAGHLFPRTGADGYLAHEMANAVLGGHFNARVNMNLREDKGWAYGARTATTEARGQRMWLVLAQVQTDKTKESIAELLKEARGYVGDRPATSDELELAMGKKVNSLPGQHETLNAVLDSLLANVRFGRPNDYVSTLARRYRSLDVAAIRSVAPEVIHPDQLVWLVVGDREKIEAGIRELDLGPVEVWDQDGSRIQ